MKFPSNQSYVTTTAILPPVENVKNAGSWEVSPVSHQPGNTWHQTCPVTQNHQRKGWRGESMCLKRVKLLTGRGGQVQTCFFTIFHNTYFSKGLLKHRAHEISPESKHSTNCCIWILLWWKNICSNRYPHLGAHSHTWPKSSDLIGS